MKQELENKINNLMRKTKSQLLTTRTLYHGKFITLLEEEYLLPNNIVTKRERIIKNKNKEAVIIVAITYDNKYLLVVQNRVNEMTTIEFPSGYVEINEDMIDAAKRELLEETGYVAENIKKIDSYVSAVGIDGAMVHIMMATNCRKIKEQNLGTYEYLKCHEFSYEELEEIIKNNYMVSVGNKLAFYQVVNLLDKQKISTKVKRKRRFSF